MVTVINYIHALCIVPNMQLSDPCMITRHHRVGLLAVGQPRQATNQNMHAHP